MCKKPATAYAGVAVSAFNALSLTSVLNRPMTLALEERRGALKRLFFGSAGASASAAGADASAGVVGLSVPAVNVLPRLRIRLKPG